MCRHVNSSVWRSLTFYQTKHFVGLSVMFFIGVIYKKLQSSSDLHENRFGDSNTLLIRPSENLNPYRPLNLYSWDEIAQKNYLNNVVKEL